MLTRWTLLLPILALASLAGCAAPADEETESASGAVETKAADYSKLTPGSYAGKGAMLVVTSASFRRLKASLSFDDNTNEGGHTIEYAGTSGFVDVSFSSEESSSDPYWPVAITYEGVLVIVTSMPGKGYKCWSGKKSFRRQTLQNVQGVYDCIGRENDKAVVTISDATEKAATIAIVKEDGKQERVEATFSLPATKLAGKVAKAHDDDFSAKDEYSFEFFRGNKFRWEQPHDTSDCTKRRPRRAKAPTGGAASSGDRYKYARPLRRVSLVSNDLRRRPHEGGRQERQEERQDRQ